MAGKWRYECDCHHCAKVKYVNDGVRDGYYCIPVMNGEEPLHADDDYTVRCDQFVSTKLEQISMFDN